jgi:hypothetical protein
MKSAILLTLFCSLAPSTSVAQTDFFHAWENRVRTTSAKQPAWPVPVIGSPSTIVQLARTDFVRQYTSTHTLTWNYDNGKGVNFIPFARTEFDINLAPYIQHNTPKVLDGVSDFSMIAKYRPFAGDKEKGNYSTLVQLAFSVPTGSYKNGTAVSTITPTVVAGKGFGKFDCSPRLEQCCRRVRCRRLAGRSNGTRRRSTRSESICGRRLRRTRATFTGVQTMERARSL